MYVFVCLSLIEVFKSLPTDFIAFSGFCSSSIHLLFFFNCFLSENIRFGFTMNPCGTKEFEVTQMNLKF